MKKFLDESKAKWGKWTTNRILFSLLILIVSGGVAFITFLGSYIAGLSALVGDEVTVSRNLLNNAARGAAISTICALIWPVTMFYLRRTRIYLILMLIIFITGALLSINYFLQARTIQF